MATRQRALEGVRVLDLTRTTAGLTATLILGDLGAEVIKLEPREVTPFTLGRFIVTERNVDGMDTRTLQTYRNKKSLILELRSPLGREVFYDLVRVSDVVINNYRLGVMDERGLGYEKLREINPRIIYAQLTGFGTFGSYKNRPGFDQIAEAYSGLASRTGEPGRPPLFPSVPIADMGTGMFATHGILAALYAREQTGEGQRVDTCLLDTCLAFLFADGTYYLNTGIEPPPSGTKHWATPMVGCFATSDGHINIMPITQEQATHLLKAVGKGELLQDPQFDTPKKRVARRRDLNLLLQEIFATQPTAHWLEVLKEADVPVGPVNTMSQAFADPAILEREMVVTLPYGGREFKVIGNPIRLSASPTQYDPPPQWGEHTEEILSQTLGYSSERIAQLREQKAI